MAAGKLSTSGARLGFSLSQVRCPAGTLNSRKYPRMPLFAHGPSKQCLQASGKMFAFKDKLFPCSCTLSFMAEAAGH